jgi:NADH:ubiquinone oxidoreductase subunit
LPKSRQYLHEEAQNDAVYEAQNDEKEGKKVRWVNYNIHMPAAAILFS